MEYANEEKVEFTFIKASFFFFLCKLEKSKRRPALYRRINLLIIFLVHQRVFSFKL